MATEGQMGREPSQRLSLRAAVLPGLLNPRNGGVVRSALLHARTLVEAGCDVVVLGLRSTGYPASGNELPLTDSDVIICDSDDTGTRSSSLLSTFEAIAPSLDCVHLNGHRRAINYEIARVCVRLSLPYIISSRCEAVVPRDSDARTLQMNLEESEYVGGAYAIHVTSSFEARRSHHCVAPRQVIQIPNQVDLCDFTPPFDRSRSRERLRIPEDVFVLVFYARVLPCKNPELLLDVLRRLRDRAATRLYFVGPVADDYRCALIEKARELEVAERVAFVGYVGGRARAEWLSAADVFVLPSFGENFCHSLVEAAAVGIPCIVSPFVGATEFLPREAVRVLPLDVDRWVEECEMRRASGADRPLWRNIGGPLLTENILGSWRRIYASFPKSSLSKAGR